MKSSLNLEVSSTNLKPPKGTCQLFTFQYMRYDDSLFLS